MEMELIIKKQNPKNFQVALTVGQTIPMKTSPEVIKIHSLLVVLIDYLKENKRYDEDYHIIEYILEKKAFEQILRAWLQYRLPQFVEAFG